MPLASFAQFPCLRSIVTLPSYRSIEGFEIFTRCTSRWAIPSRHGLRNGCSPIRSCCMDLRSGAGGNTQFLEVYCPCVAENRVSAKPPLCLFWGLDLRKASSKHPTTCSCCARSRFNFVIYFVATTALFEPWTFRHPFLVVSERLSAGRCTCLYRCNFSPLAFEPPPSFAQRSNPCCSIFNVLLSLDRCRSCLACAGRVPHEGAPLEVLLAAIPWQEVKAVDEPRRCWLRRGPQKRP